MRPCSTSTCPTAARARRSRRSPRLPGTSIVILSGDETRQIVLELISAGAIAYVRKGVTGSQLCQTLTDALKVKTDSPPA